MRVSSSQMFQQAVQQIRQRQHDVSELVEQISSGRKQLRPSDDPFVAARSLELQQTATRTEQFQENIVLARANLSQQDTVLQNVTVLLQRVRELAVQSNNSALTAENRAQIASEVDARIGELVQLANSVNTDGDYLFAGFRGDNEPFVVSAAGGFTSVSYQGDDGQKYMQVGDNRQLQTAEAGSEVFQRVRSGNALITSAAQANTGNGQIVPAMVHDPTLIGTWPHSFVPGAAGRNDVTFVDDLAGAQDGVTFQLQGRTYELDVGGGGVGAGNIAINITAGDTADMIAGQVATQLDADIAAGDLNNITVSTAAGDLQIQSDVVTATTSHTNVITALATNYGIGPAGQLNGSTLALDGVTYEFRFDNEAAGAGNVKVSLGSNGAGTADDQANYLAAAVMAENAAGNTTFTASAAGSTTRVETGAAHSYRIVFNAGATYDVVDDTMGMTLVAAAPYTAGQPIEFNGIRTSIAGTPSAGDVFSIAPGTHQDIFTTLTTFASGLRNPLDDTVTAARSSNVLSDLDAAIDHMLEQQAQVGGRLNVLDAQENENAAFNLQLREALSDITDLDYADAVARLEYSLFVLQAAQQSFARIEGVSLFDFIG